EPANPGDTGEYTNCFIYVLIKTDKQLSNYSALDMTGTEIQGGDGYENKDLVKNSEEWKADSSSFSADDCFDPTADCFELVPPVVKTASTTAGTEILVKFTAPNPVGEGLSLRGGLQDKIIAKSAMLGEQREIVIDYV